MKPRIKIDYLPVLDHKTIQYHDGTTETYQDRWKAKKAIQTFADQHHHGYWINIQKDYGKDRILVQP